MVPPARRGGSSLDPPRAVPPSWCGFPSWPEFEKPSPVPHKDHVGSELHLFREEVKGQSRVASGPRFATRPRLLLASPVQSEGGCSAKRGPDATLLCPGGAAPTPIPREDFSSRLDSPRRHLRDLFPFGEGGWGPDRPERIAHFNALDAPGPCGCNRLAAPSENHVLIDHAEEDPAGAAAVGVHPHRLAIEPP